ncbi:MAG TPA: hypothetical protein VF132_02490 [Rudaea sp.]
MNFQHFRAPLRRARGAFALAIGVACIAAVPGSGTHAQSQSIGIGPHLISSGGRTLRNSCFVLSSTAGQPAPGYSGAGPAYSFYSGFWASATTAHDEIYFNGFEAC